MKGVGINSLVTHKVGDVSVLRITVVAKCPGDNHPPPHKVLYVHAVESVLTPHSEDAKKTWLEAIGAWTCSRLRNGEAGRTTSASRAAFLALVSQWLSSHAVRHMYSPQVLPAGTLGDFLPLSHLLPRGPTRFSSIPPLPGCHSTENQHLSRSATRQEAAISAPATHLFSLRLLLILLLIRMTALSSSNRKHWQTWQQQKH